MLLRVILIAVAAGVIGTLIGGIIGIIIKKPSKTYISLMFSFAAGAMLGVALFELLPESFEYGGIWAALIGTVFGVGFIFLLDILFKKKKDEVGDALEEHAEAVCAKDSKGKDCKAALATSDKRKLRKMGFVIFIAMALHSIPEGLAIGAGEYLGIGLLLGIVLFLHFVPEGLAIALPMKASGVKVWKILLLCVAAGLPTVLGAIIGYYLGMIEVLLAYALSFAAGAMLYVVLSEMLPTAYSYSRRHRLITALTLAGVLLIVIFTAVL